MSGGGGQSGTQQTVQKQSSAPWADQQPYLRRGFQEAERLLDSDQPTYFPGDTVVGFDPAQEQALNLMQQRAEAGNPLTQQAQGYAGDVLSGNYLDAGNPYFSQMVQSISDTVTPAVTSQFEGSGRFGSGLHAGTMADAVARQAAPLAFQNYQMERGRMDNAASMAPGLADADYGDYSRLFDVGAQRQGMAQQELGADIERYNFGQNVERAKLADFMSLIQGNYGGETTSTVNQPLYRNNTANALGMASTLAGIGGTLFSPVGGGGLLRGMF